MNISQEAQDISHAIYKLIDSNSKNIGKWQLCLLGSQARGEASKKTNGISQSDIEFFLVSEKPNSHFLKALESYIRKEKFSIEVDINGTTYERFNGYSPKLWSCDSGRFPNHITKSGIKRGGPFIKFSKSVPPIDEFEVLILNRSVEWMNKGEQDSWSTIKFFGDAAFFILFKMGYYCPSYKDRYKTLRSINKPLKGIPSKNQQRVKKLLLNALYSRLEDKTFDPAGETYNSIFALAQEILKSLLKPKVSPKGFTPYPLFPSRWITDWIRAHRLQPREISKQIQRAYYPPKYRVFKEIYSNFINFSKGTSYDQLYSDWENYCKS